jgi:hypothetical protein
VTFIPSVQVPSSTRHTIVTVFITLRRHNRNWCSHTWYMKSTSSFLDTNTCRLLLCGMFLQCCSFLGSIVRSGRHKEWRCMLRICMYDGSCMCLRVYGGNDLNTVNSHYPACTGIIVVVKWICCLRGNIIVTWICNFSSFMRIPDALILDN